ncbi:MAG: acyl-CoA dehydrogenase C-terminal domain-containing protein [Deltaproteobacteria bacterium]|nr:acyl-CoA dehydrogenase C-terminal domain-containing protein [Deltaproteobacteria bacterium]
MSEEAASTINARMNSDPLQWASDTYPALTAFSETVAVWRLLDMAVTAQNSIQKGKKNDFYLGKVL